MSYYDSLDLNAIHNIIGEYLSIDEAKEILLNEEISFNPLVIKRNLQLTSEALKILNEGNIISFDGIHSCDELLDKASKDIVLTGNELYRILVFHNHCQRIKNIFKKFDKDLLLNDFIESIYLEKDLFEEIANIIDPNGELRSDASPLLKELNNKISSLEKEITTKANMFINKHSSSLQENVYYLRNNRITFLIKNSDKNKYAGYTHGTSASGLATYVEPGVFVELDNQKLTLLEDKENEEYRILSQITYKVGNIASYYKANFESLIDLSIIFAKANFGLNKKGIVASIDESEIYLKDIGHPLIDSNNVIKNTYRLEDKYQGIVISGSNTGGKTVGLKTIGLSIIMTYLGIPIICDEARVPIFDNIFVDIDDNQSITSSLSTFSAHITNINNILNAASANSLILIDELISGTDPKEAQAISLAIIDKIKDIGAKFIITTHFDDIKQYSYEDESILLSSVGFDLKSLKPTYKYIENSIGSSNALEIASRYFDDNNIIENAKKYLSTKRSSSDELINRLSNEIEENNTLKLELDNKIKEVDALKEEYNNNLKNFEEEKNKLKEKYLKELNDYIEDIKEKAQEKLDSIKDKNNTKIIEEIDDLNINEKEVAEERKFELLDNVRIEGNNQIGFISEINGDNVTVNIKNISIKTKLNKLTFISKPQVTKTYTQKSYIKTSAKEINLIGKRVEDALEELDSFLDAAFGSNLSSVKIIHGIGTGKLRKGIREHLKKLKFVKSFKDGDFYDGSSAVTIVEFK